MKRIQSNNSVNIDNINTEFNEWTYKKYVISFEINDKIRKSIQKIHSSRVVMTSKIPRPTQYLIDAENYTSLISNKDSIGMLNEENKKKWNKWIKLINPYEKIGFFSKYGNDVTISRAFYKLYEIIMIFKKNIDIDKNLEFVSLHLCEAPGGFISATKILYPNVDWYGHTLYEGTETIKIDKSLDKSKWILYGKIDDEGKEHTGNLYSIDTIKSVENSIPDKAMIITADGGFDVSCDPNNQEQFSFRLIFAEFVTALHCQKIGGTFICKVFDCVTRGSMHLMFIIMKYYKEFHIIKPRSSRISNSEKYIVAIGFRGISKLELNNFDSIIEDWEEDQFCKSLGMVIDMEEFSEKINALKEYNNFLSTVQSWYIHQSIFCVNNFKNKNTRREHNFSSSNLQVLQNKKALNFCTAFELRNSDNHEKCTHARVSKINHDIKNVIRCNNCLKILLNFNE